MSIIYLGSEDAKLYDSLIILLSCLLRAQLEKQTSLIHYTQMHFYMFENVDLKIIK